MSIVIEQHLQSQPSLDEVLEAVSNISDTTQLGPIDRPLPLRMIAFEDM